MTRISVFRWRIISAEVSENAMKMQEFDWQEWNNGIFQGRMKYSEIAFVCRLKFVWMGGYQTTAEYSSTTCIGKFL